uniref:relaxase/mobilization nuclease domain-containing protein n=1 Tax=Quadrisphaera sp. RL12-1S TaxID=2763011 RepID=UPI00351C9401
MTEAEWADMAAEVLHQTGLAPRGDLTGCRWVAVRHADDHIHLAVTLARQDGRRARASHDYARLGAACRTVEERYGLTVTPARDRTAPKRPTRAENEKAARQGRAETPRQRLRREVRRAALGSSDLGGFLQQLEAAGLQVRLRHSGLDPTTVTGYSVADPGNQTAAGDLVWFGGGKLAPHLSLRRLVSSWNTVPLVTTPTVSTTLQRRDLSLARVLKLTSQVVASAERGNLAAGSALAATALLRSGALRRRQ